MRRCLRNDDNEIALDIFNKGYTENNWKKDSKSIFKILGFGRKSLNELKGELGQNGFYLHEKIALPAGMRKDPEKLRTYLLGEDMAPTEVAVSADTPENTDPRLHVKFANALLPGYLASKLSEVLKLKALKQVLPTIVENINSAAVSMLSDDGAMSADAIKRGATEGVNLREFIEKSLSVEFSYVMSPAAISALAGSEELRKRLFEVMNEAVNGMLPARVKRLEAANNADQGWDNDESLEALEAPTQTPAHPSEPGPK